MDTIVYAIGNNLYINLTNRCSNDCTFCLRNGREGIRGYKLWLKKEPTASEIIQALEDKMNYDLYVFCGFGEPTYKIDVIEEVGTYLKSKGKKTRINTNGQANLIFNKDITEQLAKGVDIVNVSLNASNAKEYQRVCQSEFGEKAFGAMLDFAKKCKERGMDVIFSIVDCIGEEEIEACKKVAKENGIPLRIREFE